MASTFKVISIVALILGVLLLIGAAVIFVKQKIWIVMADLSGKTAQASIERLRSQSGQPAPRRRHYSYATNGVNARRSRGTDKLENGRTESVGKRGGKRTVPLQKTDGTAALRKSKEEQIPGTEVLNEAAARATTNEGTMVLGNGAMPTESGTMVLGGGTAILDGGTEVLPQGTVTLSEGTRVLNNGGTTVVEQTDKAVPEFRIITDIVMIHTSEKLSLE